MSAGPYTRPDGSGPAPTFGPEVVFTYPPEPTQPANGNSGNGNNNGGSEDTEDEPEGETEGESESDSEDEDDDDDEGEDEECKHFIGTCSVVLMNMKTSTAVKWVDSEAIRNKAKTFQALWR